MPFYHADDLEDEFVIDAPISTSGEDLEPNESQLQDVAQSKKRKRKLEKAKTIKVSSESKFIIYCLIIQIET